MFIHKKARNDHTNPQVPESLALPVGKLLPLPN